MGEIILTGLSFGNHRFTLNYSTVEGKLGCIAYFTCSYEAEILYSSSYGGVKSLQGKWEEHIESL